MRFLVIGNFVGRRVTGVQRVAIEVTTALLQRSNNVLVLCRRGASRPEWLPKERMVRIPDAMGWGPIFQLVHVPGWLILHQKSDDVVINFSNVGVPWTSRLIVCIHDCAVFERASWFSWKFVLLYRLLLPPVALCAEVVTTVSRFSKAELARHLPSTRGKCAVVGNGVSGWWAESIDSVPPRIGSYFLVVGSIDPRKDLATVIRAWAVLKDRIAGDTELVIVGGTHQNFGYHVDCSSRTDIVMLGYVDDRTLRALYRHAIAVVNASIYEGFGLPVLEARLSGARLILSDIVPYREIGGPNARFFPVGDHLALAHEMFQVDASAAVVREDIVSRHTWATVAAHYEALAKILCCNESGV